MLDVPRTSYLRTSYLRTSYLMIDGVGSPEGAAFEEEIQALHSLARPVLRRTRA
jgi:hypothetical protein